MGGLGLIKSLAEKEKQLLDPNMSGWSKVFYLEVLDASFSIDGVIGAFAFTMGARRLSEREGRLLKLMSGLMMLQLGLLGATGLLVAFLIWASRTPPSGAAATGV